MKRIAFALVALGAAFVMVACGDDTKQTVQKDTGGGNEAGNVKLDGGGGNEGIIPIDTGGPTDDGTKPTPQCDGKVLGKKCTDKGGECGNGATCLLTSKTKGGICTCQCTPDNPGTPLINEDSCPDQGKVVCGSVRLQDGSESNFCFKTCQPKLGGNDCDKPFACSPRAASASGTLDKTVCLRFGCETNKDCPVTTGKSCDTSKKGDCAANEECLPLTSTGTAGLCAEPGKCDVTSGLCDKHATTKPTAKVGDPCTNDKECGEYMNCERELDRKTTLGQKDHGAACTKSEDCCGRCNTTSGKCEGTCMVHARNGYCMISGCSFATATDYKEYACPKGSTCNKLFYGGFCMKSCTLAGATDCRGNAKDKYGDYECRAWNNLSIANSQIAATPVCDFGDIAPCGVFGTTKLTCASLGEQNNPTKMVCRSLSTKAATTDPKDPSGYCLDTTTSGN